MVFIEANFCLISKGYDRTCKNIVFKTSGLIKNLYGKMYNKFF